MQTDLIGYYDSMNLYAYCGNNPVNWIDPTGLCGKKDGTGNNLQMGIRSPGELWKDFLEHPENWEPEGAPIPEKPTNKNVEESLRQTYRNKENGERIGEHSTKPQLDNHPHYYPPERIRPTIFFWVVPKIIIDAAFPDMPGSVFNERERQERMRMS